jgi:pimeloyl-ACP methyl ester carboxylesterase
LTFKDSFQQKPSKLPFFSRAETERAVATQTKMVPTMKTQTGLSQLFAVSLDSSSGYAGQYDKDLQPDYKFQVTESDTRPIPDELSPIYRPLPFLLRLASATFSLLVAALTTWGTVMFQTICYNLWNVRFLGSQIWRNIHWKELVLCGIKSIAVYAVTAGGLQELPRYRPSRIETKALVERYYLPSKLSQYRSLNGIDLGNIHWLQLHAKNTTQQFSHAHFNHGFGASSLSWLPSFRLLSERLGIACAYAHDAPGFGFTDRTSRYIDDYSCDRSAEVGLALLNRAENPVVPNSTVLLVGHSMGAFTTLKMAIALDETVNLRVILVAPAFGLAREASSHQSLKSRERQGLFSRVYDTVAAYVLRRVVGVPGFFRAGAQLAWANPLKDADLLRFQWPAIAKGWERGILRFARAQLPSDEKLLRRVLALPNLQSINVVVGNSDRIIKLSTVRSFLAAFPTVPLSTIANCGHDPFEEDPDAFAEHLKNCLI